MKDKKNLLYKHPVIAFLVISSLFALLIYFFTHIPFSALNDGFHDAEHLKYLRVEIDGGEGGNPLSYTIRDEAFLDQICDRLDDVRLSYLRSTYMPVNNGDQVIELYPNGRFGDAIGITGDGSVYLLHSGHVFKDVKRVSILHQYILDYLSEEEPTQEDSGPWSSSFLSGSDIKAH